jgi:hypothetical protein
VHILLRDVGRNVHITEIRGWNIMNITNAMRGVAVGLESIMCKVIRCCFS